MIIAALLLGTAGATFSQLFALARGHLDWTDKATAERGVSLLRAGFSVAWAIGPAVGAMTVEFADYRGLFLASAAFGFLAYGAVAWGGMSAPQRAAQPPSGGSARFAIAAVAISFTSFSMALAMGSVALPIVVVGDLHGTRSAVGLISSLCALLEVPVMVAVAWRPSMFGGFGAIAGGFLAFILYFVAAYWSPDREHHVRGPGAASHRHRFRDLRRYQLHAGSDAGAHGAQRPRFIPTRARSAPCLPG